MGAKKAVLVLPLLLGLLGVAGVALHRTSPSSIAPVKLRREEEPLPGEAASSIASKPPEQSEVLYRQGLAAMNRRDYAEALKAYDQAVRERPTWDEALYSRGVARMSLQDFRGAEADFGLAIEHGAHLPEAHFNRGIVRTALERPTEAILDFDAAIRLKSDWTEAYYNRALAKETAGSIQLAREDYGRVLEMAPPDSPYRSAALRKRDTLSH